MTIFDEIAARRQYQIAKGYDAAHDDSHIKGEIADAAACYASMKAADTFGIWPWWDSKPNHQPTLSERRRSYLIDAAAMIVAEIERLDRLSDDKRIHGKHTNLLGGMSHG